MQVGPARRKDERFPLQTARSRCRVGLSVIIFKYQDHIPNRLRLARDSAFNFVINFTSRRCGSAIDCKNRYNHFPGNFVLDFGKLLDENGR
jgi:hypothetical protein